MLSPNVGPTAATVHCPVPNTGFVPSIAEELEHTSLFPTTGATIVAVDAELFSIVTSSSAVHPLVIEVTTHLNTLSPDVKPVTGESC